MPDPVYTTKTPDQLIAGDIIPKAGGTLVIDTSVPVTPPEYYGESGIEFIPIGYKVTFTDGTFTTYPTGSVVSVQEVTP